ncbi:MAG: DUF1929 domain-containing protein [Phycisphaeraceae bacterium]|nr:DUF1929 domain-containing protein [Phycisphaeraceae bacterium]
MQHRAIHLAHLKIGQYLYWADGSAFGTPTALYDASDTDQQPIYFTGQNLNLHCCGHCALPDGRILTAGGEFDSNGKAPTFAAIFDANALPSNPWTRVADMHEHRWYPTCTLLPSGKVAVFGGWITDSPVTTADTPEVYHPATDTWSLESSATRVQEVYPFMFVMPDGRLFDAGPHRDTFFLDLSTWTWGAAIDSLLPHCSDSSAVMFDAVLGRVLKAGGAPVANNPTGAATDMAVVFGGPTSPTWTQVGNMNLARRDHNMVVLPDGKVVALGGCALPTPQSPVMRAEVFDPSTGQWTVDPVDVEMAIPRWYHSSASLMDDGRVMTAGGDNYNPPVCQNAQYYVPAYLQGNPLRSQWVMNAVPQVMEYGVEYTISVVQVEGRTLKLAALTRLTTVTHGFDQDQRYVPLKFEMSGGQAKVTAPANAAVAPPGYYLLWVLDDLGVPCLRAAYVRIGV